MGLLLALGEVVAIESRYYVCAIANQNLTFTFELLLVEDTMLQ